MTALDSTAIGRNLESARKSSGFSQVALARAAKINRVQIVRMEAGQTVPRLDEAVQLAKVLKVPLEFLTNGRCTPTYDLRGIAVELYRLGIRDLEVADPRVPGTFRHKEELLFLAVAGERPEPRVIEAIPYLLLLRHFLPKLVTSFAKVYDERALTRLAWLSEIALALVQVRTMPLVPFTGSDAARGSIPSYLYGLIEEGEKALKPDSLGHPGTERFPPIWKRWNITYAGTMDDFLRRSIECHAAFEATRTMLGDEL